MMAWSDGNRTNIVPSVRKQVDTTGRLLRDYNTRLEEGYEIYWNDDAVARNRSCCLEYDADQYWQQGRHLCALRTMMYAANNALPDDGICDDVCWLDPWEVVYWHPNIKEFLRLVYRCHDYCRRDPLLLPFFNGSTIDRMHRKHIEDLHRWRYDV